MARVRQVVLGLGAFLGAVCLLAAAAVQLLGLTPLVFLSGSMGPQIEAGDLAVSRTVPSRDLAVGDVVSVVNDAGVRVTHRVVAVARVDDRRAVLTLRGDANARPDTEAYDVTDVQRVSFAVPHLGHVVSAVSSPVGRFAAGAYVGICILVLLHRPRPDPRRGGSGRPRHRQETRVAAAVLAAVALVAPVSRPTSTLASFTDGGTFSSGTLSTHIVQRSSSMTCSNGPAVLLGYYSSVTVGVTHVDSRYDYVARVYNSSGTKLGDDIAMSSGTQAVGSTVTTTISAAQVAGLLPLGATVTVRVYSRLKTENGWESSTYRSWTVETAVLGALLLNGIRCGADTSPS